MRWIRFKWTQFKMMLVTMLGGEKKVWYAKNTYLPIGEELDEIEWYQVLGMSKNKAFFRQIARWMAASDFAMEDLSNTPDKDRERLILITERRVLHKIFNICDIAQKKIDEFKQKNKKQANNQAYSNMGEMNYA